MSGLHTYTSCYKVIVPPVDMYNTSRRTGVRMRERCEPLNELKDFDVLYLPQQLRADYLESEAERLKVPLIHPPGWVENVQTDLDEEIARQGLLHPSIEVGSDFGLNGSFASKHRHALRHEFAAIRGPTGATIFAPKYQRGAHQTRKGKVDRATSAREGMAALNETKIEEPLGGLPYWMRVEPAGVSLPRSTTQATYRAIPEESFLLDQKYFHDTMEALPPPTPAYTSTGELRPYSPRSELLRTSCRRIPLSSNEQPSIFFRIPDRASHPEYWRKSKVLRQELNERKRLESSARHRSSPSTSNTSVAATTVNAPPTPYQPPQSARTHREPLRPIPSPPSHQRLTTTSSHLSTGSQTSRVHHVARVPPLPRPATTNSETTASPSSITMSTNQTSSNQPSLFQQHMERARARLKQLRESEQLQSADNSTAGQFQVASF